ncbi:cephalosporin hydroxylase family protein [Deltaproteobacteria bacterium OttesenSCG-928-K17]|nr:cephalosporin hydroxylase family protein [Deltaproteobacteria bacterium OttesenSCG-928-K17]
MPKPIIFNTPKSETRSMDPVKQFEAEREARIKAQANNLPLKKAADDFLRESLKARYSYNFSWLGRPVIQYPEDLMAVQEIIWRLRPRLIIETGIAHGGSVLFHASMLELIGDGGLVLGIDIDIRAHNRPLIENHPLAGGLKLLEADSIGEAALGEARRLAALQGGPVLVILDSNHSEAHVKTEMDLYGPLVSPGSYLLVFDTVVEKFPAESVAEGRPWGLGDNPTTAVQKFLADNSDFENDRDIEDKLLITQAPGGWLRRK